MDTWFDIVQKLISRNDSTKRGTISGLIRISKYLELNTLVGELFTPWANGLIMLLRKIFSYLYANVRNGEWIN